MSTKLRSDITGLRAVAVLAVTLFHISHVFDSESSIFVGGFLGVDIFFVISGFLMTMIIFTGLQSDTFCLWGFYKRRAKRICPALFVVILCTILIAYFITNINFLSTTVLREGLVALGFVSNFRFAREVDYFDGGDFTHLFLHTWSLSVEWQFYIFYPLLLICLNKFIGSKYIGRVLVCLTVLGFITAIVWTEFRPRQSYYLLPSRACELLVGSLAYFYPLSYFINKLCNNSLIEKSQYPLYGELIGLFLIALSLLCVNDKSGWPTAVMIIPLAGTWLCIASGNSSRSLLRGMFFQKIGIWSYSIYLVHWPIIVFVSMLGLSNWAFIWIAPIFALGILLHYIVERKRSYGTKFLIFYFSLAGLIYVTDAHKLLFNFNTRTADLFVMDGNEGFRGGETLLIGKNEPEFILQGDSHSLDYVKPFIERNHSFILNSKRACYSLGNHADPYIEIGGLNEPLREDCRHLYNKTKALAKKYPHIPVIFSFNWPIYGQLHLDDKGLRNKKFIDPISGEYTFNDDEYYSIIYDDLYQVAKDLNGHKVFIIGRRQGNPLADSSVYAKQKYLNYYLGKRMLMILNASKQSIYEPFEVNNVLIKSINHITALRNEGHQLAELIYVNPDIYCSNSKCDLFVSGYTQIYSDSNHYSWAGAEKPVTQLLLLMGKGKSIERTNFDKVPDIDFEANRTVLYYSENDGFKL